LASVKGLNLVVSICIGAGPKEADRATGVVWGTKGNVVGRLFQSWALEVTFFSWTFEQTIIAPNCLGDGFTEGRRVYERQQKILNIITKPTTKLINQGSFSPIDVAGKLPEF
jgi:hypothetical protein